MDVSIVMGYYNRKEQLLFTLKTIEKYKGNYKIEVIVCDDASNDKNRLENIEVDKDLNFKLLRIDPHEKKHINPCIAYNKAIAQSSGNIVIIQNPECCHMGNIIEYCMNNLVEDEYLSFGCYGMPNFEQNKRLEEEWKKGEFERNNFLFNTKLTVLNNTTHRPKAFHFCAALHKKNLNKLKGFDERYSNGTSYDDREFIERVRLLLKVKIIDEPFVVHLYHDRSHIKGNLKNNIDIFINHMMEIGNETCITKEDIFWYKTKYMKENINKIIDNKPKVGTKILNKSIKHKSVIDNINIDNINISIDGKPSLLNIESS